MLQPFRFIWYQWFKLIIITNIGFYEPEYNPFSKCFITIVVRIPLSQPFPNLKNFVFAILLLVFFLFFVIFLWFSALDNKANESWLKVFQVPQIVSAARGPMISRLLAKISWYRFFYNSVGCTLKVNFGCFAMNRLHVYCGAHMSWHKQSKKEHTSGFLHFKQKYCIKDPLLLLQFYRNNKLNVLFWQITIKSVFWNQHLKFKSNFAINS